MLNLIKKVLAVFSPYASPFEKRVDRFLRRIRSTDNRLSVQKKLLNLMQKDLVSVNLWIEKKFKGYKYLSKKVRREMYRNNQEIKKLFLANTPENLSELDYLKAIMEFLKPGNHYKYIKTASFGKLLRDPAKTKLEGDCNQIVTYYIYLFSLRFPVSNLQIKLLPEHVCLHYQGRDIEATNATFQQYKNYDHILPVTEIISTNLLDISDFREETQSISPKIIVKSAQLAYAISSLKELVTKNLKIAYHNLANAALKSHDFSAAIFYISKTDDTSTLQTIYHNAAIYYTKAQNFKKALFYANKKGDSKLEENIKENQAAYYYKKDNITQALKIYRATGNHDMIKACYGKLYNKEAAKVKNINSLSEAKHYKSTYRKMLEYAQKLGDSNLERQIRDTLNKL